MVGFPVVVTVGTRSPLGCIENVRVTDSVVHGNPTRWALQFHELEVAQLFGWSLVRALWTPNHVVPPTVEELSATSITTNTRRRALGEADGPSIERTPCVGNRQGEWVIVWHLFGRTHEPLENRFEPFEH